MIPRAYLQEWSARAPWPDPRQVEQDLIICRALCDLFNAPKLKDRIAFRGGTAINKLLFRQPLRYSEDIDLVQVRPERIGPTIDAVREALAWLGDFHRDRAGHSIHLWFWSWRYPSSLRQSPSSFENKLVSTKTIEPPLYANDGSYAFR